MSEQDSILVEKLVHGGQAIATLKTGKRVFLWNALPGEQVVAKIVKQKRGMNEGVAESVLVPSADRVEPKDEAFLSTSPWQIMSWEAENRYKREILLETFQREHVQYEPTIELIHGEAMWEYRNKMEYSFWADDDGLHLALYHRGTHGKRIVTGSSIALPHIDITANKILNVLNEAGIRGSQLKTVVVRANQKGECVAALFVKDQSFPEITSLRTICRGITVCFSNPRSPASVLTDELYAYGDCMLTDTVLGVDVRYDVHSFFQVNLPVFEMAAKRIRQHSVNDSRVIDMYSGVGTIGLSCGASVMVEVDARNIAMARINIEKAASKIEVIHASAETASDYMTAKDTVIVDPPRAGLHPRMTESLLETLPAKIMYLSCNPITQARDIAILQSAYKLQLLEGYNFFPRTPHIESLALLSRG